MKICNLGYHISDSLVCAHLLVNIRELHVRDWWITKNQLHSYYLIIPTYLDFNPTK